MNTRAGIIYTYHTMPKIQAKKQEAYKQAISFRKRGFTYTEIAKICNVSRGTVSNWLRTESFSQVIAKENMAKAAKENKKRLALINKARVVERKEQYVHTLKTAETEYKHYKHNPLFVAGLTLYLTIGDTTDPRRLRITSARTDLHRLFITFTTEYLGVDKKDVRFWLLLYPDHDEVTCMKHWCKKTDLSPAQFHKNQVVSGRSQHNTLHFGVGNTIIGSTLLKQKLQLWLKLFSKEYKY
jgi:transcriptional regulator with XRE-family HTH domain